MHCFGKSQYQKISKPFKAQSFAHTNCIMQKKKPVLYPQVTSVGFVWLSRLHSNYLPKQKQAGHYTRSAMSFLRNNN
jgi:hypothetical protein